MVSSAALTRKQTTLFEQATAGQKESADVDRHDNDRGHGQPIMKSHEKKIF
jgi:hypothetical protein